jgi:hypothetical protein
MDVFARRAKNGWLSAFLFFAVEAVSASGRAELLNSHSSAANNKVTVAYLTNILGSRPEEWSLLTKRLGSFHADPNARLVFSSLAVDIWDAPKHKRAQVRMELQQTHKAILARFDQVLFFATGARKTAQKHVKSSLTYYRHWTSTFDALWNSADNPFAPDANENTTPQLLVGMDARYDGPFDSADAFAVLSSNERYLLYTDWGCFKKYKKWAIDEGKKANKQLKGNGSISVLTKPASDLPSSSAGFLAKGTCCLYL